MRFPRGHAWTQDPGPLLLKAGTRNAYTAVVSYLGLSLDAEYMVSILTTGISERIS